VNPHLGELFQHGLESEVCRDEGLLISEDENHSHSVRKIVTYIKELFSLRWVNVLFEDATLPPEEASTKFNDYGLDLLHLIFPLQYEVRGYDSIDYYILNNLNKKQFLENEFVTNIEQTSGVDTGSANEDMETEDDDVIAGKQKRKRNEVSCQGSAPFHSDLDRIGELHRFYTFALSFLLSIAFECSASALESSSSGCIAFDFSCVENCFFSSDAMQMLVHVSQFFCWRPFLI
jgi:hypothetical protein